MSPQIKETPPQGVTVLIPERLKEVIEGMELTRKSRTLLSRLTAICWHRYLTLALNERDFYSQMSKDYVMRVTSERWYKGVFLKIKEDHKAEGFHLPNIIFQSNGSYDVEKGEAKRYRINPELLKGKLLPLEVDLYLEENSLNSTFPNLIRHFDLSVHSLSIDSKRVSSVLEEIISPILVSKEGYSIVASTVAEARDLEKEENPIVRCDRVIVPGDTIYSKGWGLVPLLDRLNEQKITNEKAELLVDGKTAFIGDFQRYLKHKQKYMLLSAEYSIQSIESGATYRSISRTNGRMHTSISNVHSTLLPFLTLEGEHLAAWDLRSSQPCILANLLGGNEDFLNSLRESKYPKLNKWVEAISRHTDEAVWGTFLHGLLYEDIYEKISSETDNPRSWAKGEFMTLLFSHYRFNSPITPLLKRHFPGLSESLRAVQKTCIEELEVPLAVVLQTIEGHIFLENILSRIAEIELPAFTRHDSILFADTQERREQVKGIIDEVFEYLGFRGEMKYSSYSILNTDNPLFYSPIGNDYYVAHSFLEDEGDIHLEIQQCLMDAGIGEFSSTDFDWNEFKSPAKLP